MAHIQIFRIQLKEQKLNKDLFHPLKDSEYYNYVNTLL